MKPLNVIASLVITLLIGNWSFAATRTWTGLGSDNRFSTSANWAENSAPVLGDDLVFPPSSSQYSVFNDVIMLTASQFFSSLTFLGGNYLFVGANVNTNLITVSGGDQDLGQNLKLNGTMFVSSGATVRARIFGRDSTFTIDGPGTSTVKIYGASGGTITKQGSGTATVDWMTETVSVDRVTVNGGHLIGMGVTSNLVITNGSVEGQIIQAGILKVTGSGSEFKPFQSGFFPVSFEVSDGAKFSPTTCDGSFQSNSVVLTGAVFNPLFSNCSGDPSRYLIQNLGSSPVTGEFSNYPEGLVFDLNGRKFKMSYHGGDGNDVQIRAVAGTPFDFDGDGRSDVSTYRQSNGTWYIQIAGGFRAAQWGLSADKPVPADYDGDGKTDIAIFRPADGLWYILRSSDSTTAVFRFGIQTDIVVPADYDGDGISDIAVFRPSDGGWWINQSLRGLAVAQFGLNGDRPVPADYDGDGRTDLAVFRPTNGTWYLQRSQAGGYVLPFGLAGDKIIAADYDDDGKTDIAVFRPSEGVWYQFLWGSQTYKSLRFGLANDVPAPADYDGDGRTDLAVFRPSTGQWWIDRSASGLTIQQFGIAEDLPLPGSYVR